jgi:hypothetical protein
MAKELAIADWCSIELDYRAGIKTLRQIASAHGITEGAIRKRAKKEDWDRDLSQKIQSKADSLVRKELVRKEYNAYHEKDIVEENAEIVAAIRIGHRRDIQNLRDIAKKFSKELEDAKPEDIALNARVNCLKNLSDTTKTLIALEREAFGITAATASDDDSVNPARSVVFKIVRPDNAAS